MHVPFMQQPPQLIVPQLQPPFMHVCPLAHIPHALPPEPHVLVDCDAWATQCPWASQQPFGQVVGLQTHLPAFVSHVCPVAQAAHIAPAVPHAFIDWPVWARHAPFGWQQPPGQEAGVQTHVPVASQVAPVAHAVQAAPWLPHCWSVDGTHRPAAVQHPLQEARSHAQAPDVQVCDGAQAVQAAPASPQAAAVGGLTHWPF